MKTPNGREEIEEMFGNPANSDGTLNEAWEGENIHKVASPNGWQLFYQADTGLVRISGIRMHRLLEDNFIAVLDDVWDFAKNETGEGSSDDTIRGWLHTLRVDQTAGGFNFRKITARQGSLASLLWNRHRLGGRTQSPRQAAEKDISRLVV